MEVGQWWVSWWAANLCAWQCHHQHCLCRTLDSTGHTRRRSVLPGEQVVCGCVLCGSWGLCHEGISDFIYLHNRLLFHLFSRLRYALHKASEAFAHVIVAIRHIIIVTDYHWNKVPLCWPDKKAFPRKHSTSESVRWNITETNCTKRSLCKR